MQEREVRELVQHAARFDAVELLACILDSPELVKQSLQVTVESEASGCIELLASRGAGLDSVTTEALQCCGRKDTQLPIAVLWAQGYATSHSMKARINRRACIYQLL